jgi:hypothetical protein
MKTFILIKNERVLTSSIKRYKPEGDKNINIYFSSSRLRPECTALVFKSKIERNRELHTLDLQFIETK